MGYDDDDKFDFDSDSKSDYDNDSDLECEEDDIATPGKDVVFNVLTRDDVRARVDEAASEIANQLSVPMSEAVVLLSKHGWNPSKLHEEWFSDEAKTRKNCGLMVSSDGTKTDDKLKYENHVLRSYVESRKTMKWCPSPEGCEFVIECEFRDTSTAMNSHLDVVCKCEHGFCWNCSEENHSPADCDLVAKWTEKNEVNKEWMTYIASTRFCSKCSRSIVRNEGPTNDLERYIHCHERWSENHRSRMKAMESMKKFEEEQFQNMSNLQFMTDAWAQIVEFRRILKWSYVCGYYEEPAKRPVLEYRQGFSERVLRDLEDLLENYEVFYKHNLKNLKKWETFRARVLDMTNTLRYFDIMKAMANHPSDVQEHFVQAVVDQWRSQK